MHTHQSRNTLHRYDLDTGRLSTLDTPPGTIGAADARPDGTVEYTWSSAAQPSRGPRAVHRRHRPGAAAPAG